MTTSPKRGKNPALVRNGHKNAKLRAEVLARYGARCHLCQQPIDLTLKYPHPMSYEVDHLWPVSKGGPMYDPATCRPAHRRHNGQRGARSVDEGRQAITKPPRKRGPSKAKRRTTKPVDSSNDPPPPPGWGPLNNSRDWSEPSTRTDLTW